MRINDEIFDNVQIRVIEDKKVLTGGGLRRVFVYEASIQGKERTRTKRSENLSELERWILRNRSKC